MDEVDEENSNKLAKEEDSMTEEVSMLLLCIFTRAVEWPMTYSIRSYDQEYI